MWAAEREIVEVAPAEVLDAPRLDPRHPRLYQREALDRWHATGRRGSIVRPTGSGKSFVAALAIQCASNRGRVFSARCAAECPSCPRREPATTTLVSTAITAWFPRS